MPVELQALLATRRPGWSMPRAFYTDADLFASDLRKVFMQEWLFAGHVSRLKRAGDYFTFAIGDESLIVICDAGGAIRAHFNVCRHRGSRICTDDCGHAPKLVCPYHQWVYGHDGALLSARAMPEDFNKEQFGLKSAHVRVIEGFIFVSLAKSTPDFAPIERDFTPFFKPHGFPDAKICFSHQYDVRSNWKLIVENSRECYHCHIGHPEYCRVMMAPGSSDTDASADFQNERIAHYEKMGLPSRRIHGDGHHASRYPFGRPGYVSESIDGKPVAPLMGALTEPDCGVLGAVLFPNFMFEACGDHAVSFRFTPVSATLTQVQADWYVRGDAVEDRDYTVPRVIEFWKTTGEQDWKLCEDNQAGVNSCRYEPGPFSEEEGGVERFVQWYLGKLTT